MVDLLGGLADKGIGATNPYVGIGTQIGKVFGFDPVGSLFKGAFGGIFGGDRGIKLPGVNLGDTSKLPPLIQQQLGLVPTQGFKKSKYRHLGSVVNKQLQEMDRVMNRTLSRAAAIAQAIPEFAPLRDQLIRDRNAFIKPNTSGGYGSPDAFSNALQKAYQDTVIGEGLIEGFRQESLNNPAINEAFLGKYGTSIGDFFGELNRRSEFDIARSQLDNLRGIAADPNNPMSAKAKADLVNLQNKMRATSTEITDLTRILPNAQPGSRFVYNGDTTTIQPGQPAQPRRRSSAGRSNLTRLALRSANAFLGERPSSTLSPLPSLGSYSFDEKAKEAGINIPVGFIKKQQTSFPYSDEAALPQGLLRSIRGGEVTEEERLLA